MSLLDNSADKPVLDGGQPHRFRSAVYAVVRRGANPETGEPVWVAYGWLRGNPRAGVLLTGPIETGSGPMAAQLMWCLQELEIKLWGTDNDVPFPRSN